jgi:hypothetical protein
MLEEANISCFSVLLHDPDDAHHIISTFSTFNSYSCMLLIGDDCFVSTVNQEIMLRTDAQRIYHETPFVPITRKQVERQGKWYTRPLGLTRPGRAAMMKSVMSRSHIPFCDPLHALYLAIRGRTQAMDMSEISLDTGEVIYASLRVGWGLINLDEDDQVVLPTWLRVRARCGGMHNSGREKPNRGGLFRGSISMQLVPHPPLLRDRGVLSAMVSQAIQEDHLPPKVPYHVTSNDPSAAMTGGGGGGGTHSPTHTHNTPSGTPSGTPNGTVSGTPSGTGTGNNHTNSLSIAKMVGVNVRQEGTDDYEDQDNPHSIRIRGSFAFLWIVQTAYARDSQHLTGPGIRMDDGVFTVYLVHEEDCQTVREVYSLFQAIQEGKHMLHKSVRVFQCTSFSLDPDDYEHYLSATEEGDEGGVGMNSIFIDGFQYYFDRNVVGKILPGAARVLVLPQFR